MPSNRLADVTTALAHACHSISHIKFAFLSIPQKKKYAAKKAATAAAMAAKKTGLAEIETTIATEQAKVQDMGNAVDLVKSRQQVILGQMSDYHKLKDERDGHKDAIEMLRAERSALFTKKEDIGATFAGSKKELEQLHKKIHDLETKMEEEIEPLKAANDKLEVDNVGKESEYKDLLTMMEGLRAMTKDLEDSSEVKLLEQETEHDKKMTEEAEAKLAALKSQLEVSSVSLAKIQEEKKAYEAAASEIKDLNDQVTALEKSIQALQDSAESKRAENEALVAVYRSYEIHRDAVTMLKQTQKIEANLEEDPSIKATYF